MRRIRMTMLATLLMWSAGAQPIYLTKIGEISFFSKTPMENIEAVNNEVSSMLNTKTGEIVFAVPIRSFRFEKALMEEHFNENYLESDKMPKATFQGNVTNLASIDFDKQGTFPATVEGDLVIHGVKQHIVSNGTLTTAKEGIAVESSFTIKLADYNIERPSLVIVKIAETIDIKVKCHYDSMP